MFISMITSRTFNDSHPCMFATETGDIDGGVRIWTMTEMLVYVSFKFQISPLLK